MVAFIGKQNSDGTVTFRDSEVKRMYAEIERLRELMFELVVHVDGIIRTSDGVNIKADTGALQRRDDGVVPW